ncbi:MAG TPA: hypothetical protein VK694_02880 [Verrucomicrobiae bacterium]|nr:hypothetical protein [Verrucomicrobiae bacterium]
MPRIKHYAQLVVFDTLAVLCMLAALLTGWLPGPGGIPLFLIGLSLLAINHDWAQRYIDLLREYADKISDVIFTPPRRVFFDTATVVLLIAGVLLLVRHSAIWMVSAGIFCIGFALLCFFGNRNRWARVKNWVAANLFGRRKH